MMKRKHNLTIVNQEISKDDSSLSTADHYTDNSKNTIKKKKKKHTKYENNDGEKNTLLTRRSDSIDNEAEQNEDSKVEMKKKKKRKSDHCELPGEVQSECTKILEQFDKSVEKPAKKKHKKHTKYENKNKDGEQNTLLTRSSDSIDNEAEQNEDSKMEMKKKKKKKSDHCELPGAVQSECTKILEQFDKSVEKPAKKKYKKHTGTKYENKNKDGEQNTLLTKSCDSIDFEAEQNEETKKSIVKQEISKDYLSLKTADHFLDNSKIKKKKKKKDKDGERNTLLTRSSDAIDNEAEQNEEMKKKKKSIENQEISKDDLSLKTADHYMDNSKITNKKKRKKHTQYENKDKDGEQNTLLTRSSDLIDNEAEQNEDSKVEIKKKKKKKSDHCEVPGEVQRECTNILEQFDKSVEKPAKKKHKKHKRSHDRIESRDGSMNSDELLINSKIMETHEEDHEQPPRSTKNGKLRKKHKQTFHIESEEIIKHDVNEDATEDHITPPDDHITPPDDPTISSSRQYPASIKDYYTAAAELSVDQFLEGGFETFPSAQLHDFGIWKNISKETTVKLQEKGMQIQTGMWKKWEDEILKANMHKFCEEVNIYDIESLVFPNLNTEDKEAIWALIKEKQMYHKLGNGINRTLKNIYFRCRKIFDKNNYKGLFSDHEVKTILRLQKKYGNKWIKIGRLMDRSGPSIQTKIRFGMKDKTIGAWSKKERKQLIKAVKEHVSEDAGPEAWYYNIPWEKVQKKVPTREARQCRSEWLTILCSLAQGTMAPEVDSWDKSDNVQLIERIYEMNIHDEEEIDWLALMPEFEKAVSPQKLRYRWYIIKSTYVPRHSYKTLDEILDYVGDEVLPKLKEQVKKMKRKKKEKRKRKLQELDNQCDEESDTVN